MSGLWPWLALAGLGAYHGVNPAMGWLFAVARGMQQRSRGAVLRSLPPIALGHLASIALVVLLIAFAERLINPTALRVSGALALIGFGLFKLLKPRSHPKWVGFRVNSRDLALWLFLMSTAHGAGLMLFPVMIEMSDGHEGMRHTLAGHQIPATGLSFSLVGLDIAAVLVHMLAMLLVMALVAVVFYEKVGLTVLRRAWLNLDLLWAGAVIAAGAVTLASA